jgi:endonuclease/exonuclease/phosphatase (EEP) superfamily protein YafD
MAVEWITVVLLGTAVVLVTTTLLPLWRTTLWWVRLWDFPRFQIAVAALLSLIATLVLRTPMQMLDAVLSLSFFGVAAWQWSWIGPYLPFARRQMQSTAPSAPAGNRLRLVTTNVLQTSRCADRLIALVRRADPDVILAVEVDEWWIERLSSGLGAMYSHKVAHPLSNGYGVALFSRLELIEPEVRFVLDPAIPSIRTGIRLRSGSAIDLYGVHPRPPSVLQDSTERDVELLRIATEIRKVSRPAIVLGDLNDVAWSPTTSNFMRAGELLDPRRGRGFFNTYPAHWPGLRYPLDYIFTTKHFSVGRMKVLPKFGSDHLPLIAEFTLTSG